MISVFRNKWRIKPEYFASFDASFFSPFKVERIFDKSYAHMQMKLADMSKIKDAYRIADVGGHFINITSCSEDGKIEYFDPYQRITPKEYTLKDVKGIYLISWDD